MTTKAKAKPKTKAKEKSVEVKKVKSKAEESFLPSLRHDIEDAFTHVLESWPRPVHWRWPDFEPLDMFNLPLTSTRKMNLPKVDFTEVDGNYELTAELPGMTDKDVECTLSSNMLTVKGEKREETVKEKKGYHLQERRYVSFMRSFPLPKDVNPDKIEASVSNGLLRVILPKDVKNEATRKIELKTA